MRFKPGPAAVHKLGPFGSNVSDFEKTYKFYTGNFTFKPSDILYTPDGKDVSGFFHLDRGDNFVDHHSFFVQEKSPVHVHHCSFESMILILSSLDTSGQRRKDMNSVGGWTTYPW